MKQQVTNEGHKREATVSRNKSMKQLQVLVNTQMLHYNRGSPKYLSDAYK